VTTIRTKTSFGVQAVVQGLEGIVSNLDAGTACPANEVVVNVIGSLINELPVADVGGHDQALFRQKAEGAVNGRFGQARKLFARAMEDFSRGKMSARVEENVKDGVALGGKAKATGAKLVGKRVFHKMSYLLLQVFTTTNYIESVFLKG
jgi:hypothetical protein